MEKDFEIQRSKHSTSEKNKKTKKPPLKAVLPVDSIDEEVYSMRNNRRGKAIIFNHIEFKNCDINKERKGSELDAKRLTEEFETLGFEVDLQTDRTLKGLKKKLREVADEDHTDADCLVVVVMTHGDAHHDHNKHPSKDYSPEHFCSFSTLAAFDDFYDEEEIFKHFRGDRCPSLAGKPKIFIIQACRGSRIQEMVLVDNLELAEPQSLDLRGQAGYIYPVPPTADFLIARATFEGTKAFRNKRKGSPFIQILCNELSENNTRKKPLDLKTLLTNVARKVALTTQQMPTIYSTLLRRLYLTPKRSAVHVNTSPPSEMGDVVPNLMNLTMGSSNEEQVNHERRPNFNFGKSATVGQKKIRRVRPLPSKK